MLPITMITALIEEIESDYEKITNLLSKAARIALAVAGTYL